VKNIQFVGFNMTEFIRKSELRKVWLEVVGSSPKWLPLISDLLRVLIMYEHGGTYLDTDTITFDNVPDDLPNFCEAGKA